MKIKKLKKLSIFSMIFAFALAMPVFATEEQISEQNLNVTVFPYISITQEESNMNASTRIVDESTLELINPIEANYRVDTNYSNIIVISAFAPTAVGYQNALFGDEIGHLTIVFAKSDGSASESALAGAALGDRDDNINAIAFEFTADTPYSIIGNSADYYVDNDSYNFTSIHYDLENGSYELPISIKGESIPESYSPDDSSGEYKAVLVISNIEQ